MNNAPIPPSSNRRQFLRDAALTGLVAAVGPGLLAACSSSPSASGTSADVSKGSSATSGGGAPTTATGETSSVATVSGPSQAGLSSANATSTANALPSFVAGGGKDVDQVTWATPTDLVSLDYTIADDFDSNTVIPSITESLLKFDENGALQPNLCESYSYASPTSLVLKIRSGVSFHDGSTMTADDVAFSINRTTAGTAIATNAAAKHVRSAAATGDNEVTITFKEHDPNYLNLLATVAGSVTSKAFVTAKGKAFGSPSGGTIGTGPYKFVHWISGQEVAIARNDSYWNKDVQLHVKNFTVKIVPDPSTMIFGLKSGSIDGVFSPALTGLQTASLKSAPNLNLLQSPSFLTELLAFNTTAAPFNDARVRRALSYAIDRKALVQAAWGGLADPTVKSPAHPSMWTYAQATFKAGYDALPDYSYDLDKAKQLIAEAAPASGAGGDIIYRVAWQAPLALAIQDAGNKIGLKLNPTSLPTSEYVSRRGSMQFAGALMDHTATTPDPAQVMDLFRSGSTGDDVPKWVNTTVDKDFDQQGTVSDPEARAKLIVELQQLAMADAPYAMLFAPYTTLLLNKRLGGYKLRPLWISSTYISDLSGV